MAASAVTRAQNRAIAKGTDPKAATCRAKLQRARSALNRQMDRELRLREGAENLLRATTKDGGGDNGGVGGVRNKSKSRKLIRQTVALELSFLESNVRLLADELAELNGSVDVYQYRDDDEDDAADGVDGGFDGGRNRDAANGRLSSNGANRQQRRRQRQIPMIAVPLKDTRPIDFGPPLERFISQHYGVDLSAESPKKTDDGGDASEDENCDARGGVVRRRTLSLREAIDELTQLRLDTQTPSRDADGVRLLLRYYRQLYYVDRRFFPPPSTTSQVTTTSRNYQINNHHQQQDHHYRQNKHQQQQQQTAVTDTSSSSSSLPAIYFEWYDSFGGPVPSCGQRTVRFEQACVLFNVAAVHTQMGAKYDRRCFNNAGHRDDDENSGSGKPTSSSSTSTGPEAPADGATAAAQCFLRAAGAYRHIGDTFANAPARAADLRATGLLFAVMMAQSYECAFEKLQWRFLTSVRHRCRRYRGNGENGRKPHATEPAGDGERRGRGSQSTATKRTSVVNGVGTNDITAHTTSWTELAREAAHLSRMYGDVVYNNSCSRSADGAAQGSKENAGATTSALPEVWVSVCRIKDRHYAALAYRYAACALLPYYRCTADSFDQQQQQQQQHHHHHGRRRARNVDDTDAGELLRELTTAAAAAGLEMVDDDEVTSAAERQQRQCKQLGKLLLEAAAAAHDRAARAQRLCRQLRGKAEWNTSGGGGGLLAGVMDRERQRTIRLLVLHRHDDDEYAAEKGTDGRGGNDDDVDDDCHCCCRFRLDDDDDDDGGDNDNDNDCRRDGVAKTTKNRRRKDYHDCYSDDDGVDPAAVADSGSGGGDQEEFAAAGIAGIPGLDVDRGVLIRPRTRFRLTSIAPDFTDTGDGDEDDDDDDDVVVDSAATMNKQRGGDQRQRSEQHLHEAADREERRADLFAGLGPVAVFSARHRHSRPRWVKIVRGSRHRSVGDLTVGSDDHDESAADPIQLVDRWFGFELRSHGGGTAAAAPPASVGHVRTNSQAQYAGLRRGDIVVALKCTGDSGDRVLDVRWDTCRRVAELVVNNHQRRRYQSSIDSGGVTVQLKVVTPITASTTSDGHTTKSTAMDPNKMYPRRRTTTTTTIMASPPHSGQSPPLMLSQSTSKQQRRQRRQTTGSNEATDGANKKNTWLWNPFRRRRRSVVGKKC